MDLRVIAVSAAYCSAHRRTPSQMLETVTTRLGQTVGDNRVSSCVASGRRRPQVARRQDGNRQAPWTTRDPSGAVAPPSGSCGDIDGKPPSTWSRPLLSPCVRRQVRWRGRRKPSRSARRSSGGPSDRSDPLTPSSAIRVTSMPRYGKATGQSRRRQDQDKNRESRYRPT